LTDLWDLLTGDQSTEGFELRLESPDLAGTRTARGLGVALVKAGEPPGTVGRVAASGASGITRRCHHTSVVVLRLTG